MQIKAQHVQLAVLACVWWGASVLYNIATKRLLDLHGTGQNEIMAATMLTATQVYVGAALTWLARLLFRSWGFFSLFGCGVFGETAADSRQARERVTSPAAVHPVSPVVVYSQLLPIAVAHSAGMLATSALLMRASIAYAHILKAAEPLFVAALSFLIQGTTLNKYQIMGVVVTAVAIMATIAASHAGVLMLDESILLGASSALSFALRNVLVANMAAASASTSAVLPRSADAAGEKATSAGALAGHQALQDSSKAARKFHEFGSITYVSAVLLTLTLLLLAVIFAERLENVLADFVVANMHAHVVLGTLHFMYNAASIAMLAFVAPITHALLNVGKRCAIVSVSLALISFEGTQALGFAAAAVGLALYTYGTQVEKGSGAAKAKPVAAGTDAGTRSLRAKVTLNSLLAVLVLLYVIGVWRLKISDDSYIASKVCQPGALNKDIVDVYAVHRVDASNVGDWYASPARYMTKLAEAHPDLHQRAIICLHICDIDDDVTVAAIPNGAPVIVGGGGLLERNDHWNNQLDSLVDPARRLRVYVWGVGFNMRSLHGSDFVPPKPPARAQYPDLPMPQVLARSVAYGVRDFVEGFEYLPCASSLLDFEHAQLLQPKYPFVVFEHKDIPIHIPSTHPVSPAQRISNQCHNCTFASEEGGAQRVLQFMSRGRVVLTNSYHGLLWATLLGRKVVIMPDKGNSAVKLAMFPYPHRRFSGDLAADLANAIAYPDALQEARELTHNYYRRLAADILA
jgi:hypothetical protein